MKADKQLANNFAPHSAELRFPQSSDFALLGLQVAISVSVVHRVLLWSVRYTFIFLLVVFLGILGQLYLVDIISDDVQPHCSCHAACESRKIGRKDGRTCVCAVQLFATLFNQKFQHNNSSAVASCLCVAGPLFPNQPHNDRVFSHKTIKKKVVIPLVCFAVCIAFQAWEFLGSHDDPARARSLFKSVRAGWVKVSILPSYINQYAQIII